MATQFEPPPTYAEVVLYDKRAQEVEALLRSAKFNPIWLKWFIDLAGVISASGGGGGGAISHNSLGGLQGGAANQFYHLSLAQLAFAIGAFATVPSGITVGASPFNYTNSSIFNISVIVLPGTVSKIEFSRDNATFFDLGVTAGMFSLSPSDHLRVTYTVAPTMTLVPR